jgi:uracil-DNA glycosylase
MAGSDRVRLHPSWKSRLDAQLSAPYMTQLREFLLDRKRAGAVIYPPGPQIFAALDATSFDDVRVVILGQDPYHGPGQAHGLSFSVPPGIEPPPSLKNIYLELKRDVGILEPPNGDLRPWAEQGVLLLNAVLTVEQYQAGSHQNKGWERFTDAIIDVLNRERDHLVFMLWGAYAQKKGALINRQRHCVLEAPHPSPLSAHRGFLGCGHFGACNRYLEDRDCAPVDWGLTQ